MKYFLEKKITSGGREIPRFFNFRVSLMIAKPRRTRCPSGSVPGDIRGTAPNTQLPNINTHGTLTKVFQPWGRCLAVLCLVSLPALAASSLWAIEEEQQPSPKEFSPDHLAPVTKTPRLSQEVPVYGFRQIGYDAKYLFTRPFHLDRKGKITASVTAGAVLSLFLLRDAIRSEAREHHSEDRDEMLQGVRTMGKGAIAPSLALISYLSSFATHNNREKETAFLLMESMAFSGLITTAGQFLLASERPEDGDDQRFFRSGGHGISGDAALAASIIPPLRNQYLKVKPGDGTGRRFWKRTATSLLYTGAALTAYQRVDQDKHWAPDAFLGMVTGLAVGEALCNAHDQIRGERAMVDFKVIPNGEVRLSFRLGRRNRR